MPPTDNQAELNKVEIRHTQSAVDRALALSEHNRTELSRQATDNAGLSGSVQGLVEHIKEVRAEIKYWKRMLIITMGGTIVQLVGIIWALSKG